MARITTQVDGKDVTLELDNILTEEEVKRDFVPKSVLDNEVGKYKRLLEKAQRAPDDLLADESFKMRALESWKIDPKNPLSGDQLASVTESIRARELRPVQEQLQQKEALVTKLLSVDLHRQIEQSARAIGVRDEFLVPMVEGKAPPIVAMLSQTYDFAFDADRGAHGVRGANGQFEYSSKPTNENPYKTPAEALQDWARSKEAAPFLKDPRQRVSGPGGQQGPAPTTIRGQRSVANDPVAIGRNLEAIAKGEIGVNYSSE